MINKSFFILFVSFLLVSCFGNNAKQNNLDKNNDKADEIALVNKLISTVYQVSPDIHAEILINKESGKIAVQVNDEDCIGNLNVPELEDFQIYNMKVEIDDYNFDGFKDFAIVGGYRNIQYYINLYNPKTQKFEAFDTFTNLTVNHQDKLLISFITISAGEHKSVIYKVKDFNETSMVEEVEEIGYGSFYTIDNGKIGSLAIIKNVIRYNTKGNDVKTERLLLDKDSNPAKHTVISNRLYLYRNSQANSKTTMYLVKGDTVELLDIAEDAFKVKFNNPKFGDITKWIRYSDGKEN